MNGNLTSLKNKCPVCGDHRISLIFSKPINIGKYEVEGVFDRIITFFPSKYGRYRK